MIHATDELLHTHFGKDLLSSGVDILDPATGTGTFICDLLDYFPAARKEQIRHKYLHELHANEVSILPYYIANLNIEYVFQQKTDEYVEFPNLCFVDTLDNMGFGYAGQQGDIFGSLSVENAARVKRQNERTIAVVIGNPPYNANQQNENDNNKNRTYREVDKRIKDTYIAASTAQKTKLYDMYARFFRWASDRLAANGIIAFVCNRSFIESRTFDGFRKCVAEEFSDIYIVDTKSDVRANPRIAGTTHNVFGIQTGVAVVFLVRKETPRLASPATPLSPKEGNVLKNSPLLPSSAMKGWQPSVAQADGVAPPLARIHYFTLTDEQTRKQKLEWFATTAFRDVPFQRITPDDRHTWLNQTDNDFDTLLPLCSKEVKSGKAKTGAVFELFSLGVSTNRDEWVIDYTPEALAKKMKFFADFYNNYKHTSGEYDTTIKWSRNLKRRYEKGKRELFEADRIVPIAYRPFANFSFYLSDVFIDEQGQVENIFSKSLKEANTLISICNHVQTMFSVHAVDKVVDAGYASRATVQFPLYRYENGERRENVTDWGLEQFRARYGGETPRLASPATPLSAKEGNVLKNSPLLPSSAVKGWQPSVAQADGVALSLTSAPQNSPLPSSSAMNGWQPSVAQADGVALSLTSAPKNSPLLPPSAVKGWQPSVAQADGVALRFKEKKLSLPSNPALKQRARDLRKASVLSEVLFWNQVKQQQVFGLDFDRQRVVGNYIVDFYIKRLGIVVEIDGSSHDDKEEYDAQRDEYLRALGIDVVHYADNEVKKNLLGVMENLKAYIAEKYAIVEETPRQPDGSRLADTPLSPKEGNVLKNSPLLPSSAMKGWQPSAAQADGVALSLTSAPQNSPLLPSSAMKGWQPSVAQADGVVLPDITKEDVFHYVYAVLHSPAYRRKYEQNLKRDFPRIPFYPDFWQWAVWGQELMRLHVGYEEVEPFPLERDDKPVRAGMPLPLKSKLKADKKNGEIIVDDSTTLRGVPPEAWTYHLGNRSALEWVCDQYRDYTPSDPTIREKFHTYRFADHKERVIDLLRRVCTVSLQTARIVAEME